MAPTLGQKEICRDPRNPRAQLQSLTSLEGNNLAHRVGLQIQIPPQERKLEPYSKTPTSARGTPEN